MSARRATTSAAAPAPRMRGWVWLHLLLAWLPLWVLYTTLIITAHDGRLLPAAMAGARAISIAALLSLAVLRLTERAPWPSRLTAGFVALHAVGAVLYALAWVLLTTLLESVRAQRIALYAPSGFVPFTIVGIWLYLMVAGIAYAVRASGRAARAEAAAATTQLAALRAQLNPHFLFNAMHTVVQLIPIEPRKAAQAAEEVAGLLRVVIAEDRDRVTLAEERAFVERYLAIEHLRFGERLVAAFDVADPLDAALVPSFALQTLVENAVRHGAAPRIDATTVRVTGRRDGGFLHLTVSDDGDGTDTPTCDGPGTGLRRLRDRLEALYGGEASLTLRSARGAGFTATLTMPWQRAEGGE